MWVLTDAQPWPCTRCGQIVPWSEATGVLELDCGRYIDSVVHTDRRICEEVGR